MDKQLRTNNEIRGWILFIPILIVAFVLRLDFIQQFSLSNDELSAWIRLQYPDFSTLIQEGCWVDGHPAGVQIFLYYWTQFFGDSPFILRLPFALMGGLSVLFAFLFTKRIFHIQAALFVAASLALLEFPLLYSSLARPYSSGQLFAMLNAYAWALFFFPTSKDSSKLWLKAIFLGFTFALQLYNHYFSGLLALIIGLSGFVFITRKNILAYLTAGIVATLLYLPHVPITLNHFSIGGVGEWLGKPDNNWIVLHIKHIFNNSYGFVVATIVLILFLFFQEKRKLQFQNIHLILVLWFAIPIITGFTYSRMVNPVLQNSVLVFSMPFLLVLCYSLIPKKITHLSAVSLLLLTTALTIKMTVIDDFKNKQHFEEIEEIPLNIEQINNTYNKDSITHILHTNNIEYINYFQGEKKLEFLLEQVRYDEDLEALQVILDTCKTPFFCFSRIQFANTYARNMILADFPNIIEDFDYDKLSLVELFSKTEGNKKKEDLEFCYLEASPMLNVVLDQEYSQGGIYSLKEYKHEKLVFKTNFVLDRISLNTEALLVIQILDAKAENANWQAIPLKYFVKTKGLTRAHLEIELENKENLEIAKSYIWSPKQEGIILKRYEFEVTRR